MTQLYDVDGCDVDGRDVDDHNHLNGCSVQGSLALVVPVRHGEAALEQELDHLQDEFQFFFCFQSLIHVKYRVPL